MNTKHLTDKVLVVGATLITLNSLFFFVLLVRGLFDHIQSSRDWLPLNNGESVLQALVGSLQIVFALVVALAIIALPAGVWLRLIRRRSVMNSLSNGLPHPFTPRSKYAVWRPTRRLAGRPDAFGALRTRKRMRLP